MKSKAYLMEIKKQNENIDCKQLELESLEALSVKVTSKLKQINVQETGTKDKVGEITVKIVHLRNEINADIDEYVDKKIEAIRLINQIGNKESAKILILRYINYYTWEKIAAKLHYSRQAINKKHGQALIAFQKVLDAEKIEK